MSAPAVAVRERPILFRGPMVRAMLDGRKTQTRRVVKLDTACRTHGGDLSRAWVDDGGPLNPFAVAGEQYLHVPCADETMQRLYCPYGQPGDRLWVRETWAQPAPGIMTRDHPGTPIYAADYPPFTATGFGPWRPSILMPRRFSRLTLEITGVRVERLRDITPADAIAEGIEAHDDDGVTYYGAFGNGHADPLFEFRRLWNAINAARGHGWDANPWVWVIEFARVDA